MPNVGLIESGKPVPRKNVVSVRYVVEVDGLPVYTELYDVEKLSQDVKRDEEKTAEAWMRRLTAPIEARNLPRFSVEVTSRLHPEERD